MRASLLTQLDQLNSELDDLFRELEQYPHEQLNRQPAADSWSAMQVMNHLLLSEMYSRQYCEKKLSFAPKLPTAGISDRLRTLIVRFFFWLPFRINAPKFIATDALPKESELETVRKSYLEQRQAMAKFLSSVDDQYLNKAVYKHPFVGRLSLAGMLRFFGAHFRHHRKQLRRAIQAAK